MGTNAFSEDGQLVNIDGNGNRLAALLYGPKSVIVLASMDKAAATLESSGHAGRRDRTGETYSRADQCAEI